MNTEIEQVYVDGISIYLRLVKPFKLLLPQI